MLENPNASESMVLALAGSGADDRLEPPTPGLFRYGKPALVEGLNELRGLTEHDDSLTCYLLLVAYPCSGRRLICLKHPHAINRHPIFLSKTEKGLVRLIH